MHKSIPVLVMAAMTCFWMQNAPAGAQTTAPAVDEDATGGLIEGGSEHAPIPDLDDVIAAAAAAAAETAAAARAEAEARTADPAQPETSKRRSRKECPPGWGCVTNQKLPRYVSLKSGEARVRRGPGADHKVDWIYNRAGLPMQVTAEYENWRRVQDPEGVSGWIHYALLSTGRSALVSVEMANVHDRPNEGSRIVARAEQGAIARIHECLPAWCEISKADVRGWVRKEDIWGVEADETFD